MARYDRSYEGHGGYGRDYGYGGTAGYSRGGGRVYDHGYRGTGRDRARGEWASGPYAREGYRREGYGYDYDQQYARRRPEQSPTYGEQGDQAVQRWANRYGYDLEYEIDPNRSGGGRYGASRGMGRGYGGYSGYRGGFGRSDDRW